MKNTLRCRVSELNQIKIQKNTFVFFFNLNIVVNYIFSQTVSQRQVCNIVLK